MDSSNTSAATSTMPRPSQDAAASRSGRSRAILGARQAASAPRASSQARVNGEKYAVTVSEPVCTTDQANDDHHDERQHRDRDVADRTVGAHHEHAQQQDQERPHQVELLLHREGPVVLER